MRDTDTPVLEGQLRLIHYLGLQQRHSTSITRLCELPVDYSARAIFRKQLPVNRVSSPSDERLLSALSALLLKPGAIRLMPPQPQISGVC